MASIARRCSASERGTRILCVYLTVMGLLSKTDGRYANTATSALFLDPRSPACVASTVRFLAHPEIKQPFESLTESVRNGRTVLPGEGAVAPENPVWVEFAHSMAPMMAPMAAPLGSIVLSGTEGPVSVLDIAAGHGLFGIEVAKQNPRARVVALDWAAVLEVAKANAARAGVADRFETKAGSAFEVEFGGPYDVVRAAVKRGGRVAALEFVPNEDRVSPPMAAAFSLTMLATTLSGDAYTFPELRAMYREAGFGDITAHPIPTAPHTVVVGRAV